MTAGPSAYWYLSRGTGVVTLVLLTTSVVLGIVDQRRWSARTWPRFVLDALHRNVSLLVLVLVAIHITTAVLDSFAPIRLVDAFVPFASVYRPVWLGLGALAFDMLLAVAITSVLRLHLGHRAWRRVHWLAYAVWPVALVHGLGTGTDAKSGWMLAVCAACTLAVLSAAWVRVLGGTADAAWARTAGLGVLIAAPIALAAWLPTGPLGPAWARRSGTPAELLAGAGVRTAASSKLPVPFTADFRGTLSRGEDSEGLATVDLALRLSGRPNGVMNVRLAGEPLETGGVRMSRSSVSLGPASSPRAYRGRVTTLGDEGLVADVTDSQGHSARLDVSLAVTGQTVSGSVNATRERSVAR